MTTIAADFRAGVMVSDSRGADAETWVPTTKVFRFGDELIGFSGCLKEREKWLTWHNGGRVGRFPRMRKDEFNAVILRPSGVYDLADDGHEQLMERGFHAVGSGSLAALAALLLGFDAEMAVTVACQIDANTGGDLQVYRLDGGNTVKKNKRKPKA